MRWLWLLVIVATTAATCLHLLVVDGRAVDFHPLRVSGDGGDGAALAVGRDDNAAGRDDFAFRPFDERQSACVHHLVGSRAGRRTAGDFVRLAIELAGPFGLRRGATAVCAL